MASQYRDVDSIQHIDLRNEAAQAYVGGTYFRVVRRGSTETLIIGDRAGQASGGNATWGDWDAAAEVLRPDGEGIALDLDGNEVAP